MTDNPIIGRMKCPVCGELEQDIKVNKNGNLYIFCDNGCRVNLSGKVSRKIKPVLLSGNNTSLNGAFITSIKGMKQNETNELKRNGTRTSGVCETRNDAENINIVERSDFTRTSARIDTVRRPDVGLAGVQQAATASKPRGILAGFFDDDDE